MTLTPEQARSTLAAMRLAIGLAAVATPRLAGKLFGLDPDANPQSLLLGRLFGIRNAAIGLTLLDGTPEEQRRWLRYGSAIEAVDLAALLAARSTVSKRGLLLIGATASVAAGLGVIAQGDA